MIWIILALIVVGGVSVARGQEKRTEASLLDITRDHNKWHPDTYIALDMQYRKLSGQALLQIQFGKVLLAIAIGLMFIKVIQELLS